MLCQRHDRFEAGPLGPPLGQDAMFQIYLADIGPVLQPLAAQNWPIYLGPREVWRRTGDRESGQNGVFVQDPLNGAAQLEGELCCRLAADAATQDHQHPSRLSLADFVGVGSPSIVLAVRILRLIS
jgi:hypothetical protein